MSPAHRQPQARFAPHHLLYGADQSSPASASPQYVTGHLLLEISILVDDRNDFGSAVPSRVQKLAPTQVGAFDPSSQLLPYVAARGAVYRGLCLEKSRRLQGM